MNLAKLIIGTAGVLAGATALKEAFDHEEDKSLAREGVWERLPDVKNIPAGKAPIARVATVRNIDERVKHVMAQIIKGRRDPRIRAIAVQIVSKKCGDSWCIKERDYQGELRAIFNYVRKNVRYVKDPIDRDTFQHPRRTLEWGGEDCDGSSIVTGALCGAIGYPMKCRIIQTIYGQDYDHIYMMAGLPPTAPKPKWWVPLDASVDRPAFWEPPKNLVKRMRDFPVP